MKVLMLTYFYPYVSNPLRGIFVTKRIEQYKRIGIDYTAIPIGFGEGVIFRFFRQILGKGSMRPIEQLGNAKYSIIKHSGAFPWALWQITRRLNIKWEEEVVKAFSKYLAKRIEKSFDVSSYDVIHAHGMYTPPAGLVAKILGKRCSKPYLISLHGSDVNFVMGRRKSYLDVLESAFAVIFVSEALLKKAMALGYSGKNAYVIPNGYDPEIFKPMDKNETRKQLGTYEEGYKYVGFVGNLIEVKRADKLIEVFDLVRKGYPKVKFIVVGDGYLRAKMEQEAREKGLEVLFTGRLDQSEVAKYMNAMDVMFLPSRSEGWPCVVLEAQACGTCVVGSSNGGIPEAIGFEEYVVEEGPDFEERFAKKVVHVLQNGYEAQRLIERAQKYTWENIVKMEKEVYEAVVGKAKKGVEHEHKKIL